MLLSDGGIRAALDAGHIGVSPSTLHLSVQPASVDVRLGDRLIVFTEEVQEIDPERHQPKLTQEKRIHEQGFSIMPGEFLLGTTMEVITLDDRHAAMLNGKSSLGRLGLEVHSTAAWLDPGFVGAVTLEIKNVNSKPIRLRSGMWIGQFVFFHLDQPALRPYGHSELSSRYQGQSDVTASRSWM